MRYHWPLKPGQVVLPGVIIGSVPFAFILGLVVYLAAGLVEAGREPIAYWFSYAPLLLPLFPWRVC